MKVSPLGILCQEVPTTLRNRSRRFGFGSGDVRHHYVSVTAAFEATIVPPVIPPSVKQIRAVSRPAPSATREKPVRDVRPSTRRLKKTRVRRGLSCYEGAHEKSDRGDVDAGGSGGMRPARWWWRAEERGRQDAVRARHDHRAQPGGLQPDGARAGHRQGGDDRHRREEEGGHRSRDVRTEGRQAPRRSPAGARCDGEEAGRGGSSRPRPRSRVP